MAVRDPLKPTRVECPGCGQFRLPTAINPRVPATRKGCYFPPDDPEIPGSVMKGKDHGVVRCPVCNDYRPATAEEENDYRAYQ